MVPSVYFSFFCLLVSSVSNFHPDTGAWWWWSLFFRLACSVVLWGGRNTANKYHWRVFTVIQPHWVCPCLWRVCFPSLHCSGCSAGNCLMRALVCMHFPGLSHSGSGTQVLLKSEDSVEPALCALPRSEPLRGPGVCRVWSLPLISSSIPAARFSGCTTGAPSQVDVDHP